MDCHHLKYAMDKVKSITSIQERKKIFYVKKQLPFKYGIIQTIIKSYLPTKYFNLKVTINKIFTSIVCSVTLTLKEGKIFYESWSKQPLQNAFKPCEADKGIFLLAPCKVYKYKSHVHLHTCTNCFQFYELNQCFADLLLPLNLINCKYWLKCIDTQLNKP